MSCTASKGGRIARRSLYVFLGLLFLAMVAASIYPTPAWILQLRTSDWLALSPLERFQLEAALRSTLLQALAGVILAIGGATALGQLHTARRQTANAREAQIVDTFNRSVAQLAGESSASRVAGVLALDRLADSGAFSSSDISNILTRFVRDEGVERVSRGAVETAIACLAKRVTVEQPLDISGAHLAGMRLAGLSLSHARLGACDLRGADLSGSDLRFAVLEDADLSRADLRGADLTGADLTRARSHGIITGQATKVPVDFQPS